VKEKMASVLFTMLLATILILLVIINIFVYVSGPARKTEADDLRLFYSVVNSYQLTDATYLNRHVHEKITYVACVGDSQEKLIFYDEAGLVFLLIDSPQRPESINQLIASGLISESDIMYGYYRMPVFVIDNEERIQYINFSGETVFFLKKGD
jgi:hypothetical protein